MHKLSVSARSSRGGIPDPCHEPRDEHGLGDEPRGKYGHCNSRELYYYLVHIDEYPGFLPMARRTVHRCLDEVRAVSGSRVPEALRFFAYSKAALDRRVAAIAKYVRKGTPHALAPEPGRDRYRYVIRQYAPTALIDGCWLQNMAKAATAHEQPFAQLFAHYAYKLGAGQSARNHANLFARLLRDLSIDTPEAYSRRFVQQTDILDSAFVLPAFSLALSQFPRIFLPELIGLNLAYFLGVSEYYRFVSIEHLKRLGVSATYFELNAGGGQEEHVRRAVHVVHAYVEQIRAQADETTAARCWHRLWTGFLSLPVLEHGLIRQIEQYLETPSIASDRETVIVIIRKKLPYARGHHRNARIGARAIEEWFGDETFEAEAFLDALARSPFVTLEQPEQSRLLTELLAFGGPMYQVFTPAEREAILRWITSLKDHVDAPVAESPAREPDSVVSGSTTSDAGACEIGWTEGPSQSVNPNVRPVAKKLARKELFYSLINVDLFPDALPLAERVAHAYLDQARSALGRRKLPPALRYFPYGHHAFNERVSSIYQDAVRSYKPFVPPPRFSKDEYLWLLTQLAPTFLVDGCWLQNVAKAGTSHTELSQGLFGIYCDEIGNGDTARNHPNVYRELLSSQGIEVPDITSRDFIHQPQHSDAVFALPVYLLSISQFPRSLLPEIIGLNLYIELSGLGGFYMTLVDEMRYWDLDPTIIALHLSIDNLATGHAAIAREVVEIYLDQILAASGQAAMQEHWARIWTGYVSLTIVSKAVGKSLLLKYLAKFGLKRIQRRLSTSRLARLLARGAS